MLNPSASLAISTRVLKALPGKLDIKRNSPRVPTGQGKVREICFFFKVREKSGNSVNCPFIWRHETDNVFYFFLS